MPKVTKAQLERWAECKATAAELQRQVATLKSEADAIEAIAEADLQATGKPFVTRSGFRLEFIDGRASVSWKGELVARLGAEVADAITKAAPVSKSLRITAPTTKAKAA